MNTITIVILLVALQRLIELVYAERNTRRLRAAGAVEIASGHYPLFILLHGSWLAALLLFVPADATVNVPLLCLFVLLQLARVWVVATLGRFWTTRIITLPGAPLVARGPYRFVRHPNYLVVVGEIAVLPLAFGAWQIALVYSILNAALLTWRIRAENVALAQRRGLEAASDAVMN
jgi:methyltransferase